MCCGENEASVKIADDELARVRELKEIAVAALVESNQILSKYMDIDPGSITSVTVRLPKKAGTQFDVVPPVAEDHCVQYNSGGACAYLECDPPGETRPCIYETLPG